MAKAKTDPDARRPGESHFDWRGRIIRQKQNERDRAEPAISDFAKQHGDYQDDFVMHVETATKAKALVNRGGDPVSRWTAANMLEPHQLTAIHYARDLWRRAGITPRVTANYGERIPGQGDRETGGLAEIEAREDLHRMRGHFPAPMDRWFDVFENVVRHDWPAGVAGGDLGQTGKSATARAFTIVQFVADVIAVKERLT